MSHESRASDDPIHVACVADRNYGGYAGITLYSVLRCNPGAHLHVFSDGIKEQDLTRMERMALASGAKLGVYDLGPSLQKQANLQTSAHYSRAVFGRLFMSEHLDSSVSHLLYLDCDVITQKSLSDLWAMRSQIAVVGAVKDIWVDRDSAYKAGVGLSPDRTYFNSGVLLINMDAWRERQLSAALAGVLAKRSFRYVDQDALNILIGREITALPRRWNTLVTSPDEEEMPSLLAQACNIHYCSGLKPWHAGYGALGGHGGRIFRRLKAGSPWRYTLLDFHLGRIRRKVRMRFAASLR